MSHTRILIVEDEAVVRLDLQSKLERLGHEVVCAVTDGETAISLASKLLPDLILMDVRLKGNMDGIQTAAEIVASVDVPVIYITAHADKDTLERAKLTSPFGYIIKPFSLQDLSVNIEMALSKHALEQKLRQSEARYRAVVEDQDDLIIRFSKDMTVVFVNSAYCRFIGKTQEEIIAQKVPMEMVYKEDVPKVEDILSTITFEMPVIKNENRNVDVHGGLHWMHWTDRGIFDERGNLIEYQCVAHDITEIRRVEAALLESQKLAHLGTLAGGIAHEMNSPLQVITGISDSLLKRLSANGHLNKKDVRYGLDIVSRNAWRLAGIVRALLAYARSSSENVSQHSLNEIIRQALLLLDARLKEKPIILVDTHLLEDMPACSCDDRQIIQVIINLVANAIDAMPEGGQLTITSSYDETANQFIVKVRDTGAGIPDDLRDRIFDPFFTTKPVGAGSGLGLSMAMGIVKSHNGEIHLESGSGQGATFVVTLPGGYLREHGLNRPPEQSSGRYDGV